MKPRSVEVFDLKVSTLSLTETADECARLIDNSRARGAERRPSLVFAVNPEKIIKSLHDAEIKALLGKATMLIPDGIGVCLAARLLHGQTIGRVPGSDLMPQLCRIAAERGYSVFLYGGTPESNSGAAAELKRRYPLLNIIGRCDGYQPLEGPESPVERIRELAPDIVFVALGSPKQERFMADAAEQLPVAIMQGVGGTVDVLAGTVKRAPRAFQAVGLEWMYRLLAQPTRWRRQMALVEFARMVLRQRRRPPTARIAS